MKKITILAAFALMAAGASAGQMAAPDSLWYTNPYGGDRGEWSSTTGSATWFSTSKDVDNLESVLFSPGKVAVFDDNDVYLYSILGDDPGIRTYFVDLKENFTVGGLYVDNDSITYRLAADSLTYVLTGADGARFEKRGSGAFYTDAPLQNVKITELYEGTIGRNSWKSLFLPVFGDSIVLRGTEATVDMGWKANESGSVVNLDAVKEGGYRLGADLHIPEGSTLNLIGSKKVNKIWKDTVWIDGKKVNKPVKVTGSGTLNIQSPSSRFYIGGGIKGLDYMGADFSEFYGTINVEKIGTDSFDMESSAPAVDAPDGWPWQTVKKRVPTFSMLVMTGVSLKGLSVPAQFYGAVEGDSMLYKVWLNRNNNNNLLDSICMNLKNADLHIGNWGTLACESTGKSPNVALVRVRNLNVDPTGMVLGYYKESDHPFMAIMFGSDNKDSHIDGAVTSTPKGITAEGINKRYNNGNLHGASDSLGFNATNPGVHLIKEGTGTCYLTANDNASKKGVDVYEGTVMFNNTKYTATGGMDGAKVVCRKDGTIGGFGVIGCNTELYGTIQPGSRSVDTLKLNRTDGIVWYKDGDEVNDDGNSPSHSLGRGNSVFRTTDGKTVPNLVVYADENRRYGLPAAPCFDMEITAKDDHDIVDIQGELQVYEAKSGSIKVKVAPRGSWSLNENDTIVLIKAKGEKCYEFGQKEEGYYGENIDENVSCFKTFELEPAAAFTTAGVEFELAEVGTRTWKDDGSYDDGGYWYYPGGWQLVLVVKKGGNGEAEPDAIEEVEETAMQVYPNPATDNVTVALPADATGVVAIYNLAGQLVKSVATSAPEVTVNVDDLTAGVYTVRIQTPDKAYRQRLIVK